MAIEKQCEAPTHRARLLAARSCVTDPPGGSGGYSRVFTSPFTFDILRRVRAYSKRIHTSREADAVRSVPTVYEVAQHARVSTATVSRVLSGNDRVRPEYRDRVFTAVAELGYVPSGAARDLAARRTGVLGLCFPDLVGDQDTESDAMFWYDEIIRGMERAARRRG